MNRNINPKFYKKKIDFLRLTCFESFVFVGRTTKYSFMGFNHKEGVFYYKHEVNGQYYSKTIKEVFKLQVYVGYYKTTTYLTI